MLGASLPSVPSVPSVPFTIRPTNMEQARENKKEPNKKEQKAHFFWRTLTEKKK